MQQPNSNDRTRINICVRQPAFFTYATHNNRLLKSSCSPSQRKHFDRLAGDGYLAKALYHNGAEYTYEYKATALGMEAIGRLPEIKPLTNVTRLKSDSDLLGEATEDD